jgi:predicted amidohydrolase
MVCHKLVSEISKPRVIMRVFVIVLPEANLLGYFLRSLPGKLWNFVCQVPELKRFPIEKRLGSVV